MKLGITLWGFSLGYREAVDLAPRVEEAGFQNLFMVESPLGNDGVTTVAMMAARTSRLLLGTNIANAYVRHAGMLGNAAVAIDEVAPERLIPGLGPNNRTMMTQAEFVWRDPREVLQETTATLRAVFAGRPGPAHRTPRPASHVIPIHWAGMALETCAAAGAHADGLMLYLNTPARYRRAVERFRRAATDAGRDPARLPVSLLIPTFIHEHLPTARQAAREFLVHYARWPHYAKTFAASGYAREMAQIASTYTAGDLATGMSALSDALLDDVLLLGPPSRIREGIARLAEAGVEWITLGPQVGHYRAPPGRMSGPCSPIQLRLFSMASDSAPMVAPEPARRRRLTRAHEGVALLDGRPAQHARPRAHRAAGDGDFILRHL